MKHYDLRSGCNILQKNLTFILRYVYHRPVQLTRNRGKFALLLSFGISLKHLLNIEGDRMLEKYPIEPLMLGVRYIY